MGNEIAKPPPVPSVDDAVPATADPVSDDQTTSFRDMFLLGEGGGDIGDILTCNSSELCESASKTDCGYVDNSKVEVIAADKKDEVYLLSSAVAHRSEDLEETLSETFAGLERINETSRRPFILERHSSSSPVFFDAQDSCDLDESTLDETFHLSDPDAKHYGEGRSLIHATSEDSDDGIPVLSPEKALSMIDDTIQIIDECEHLKPDHIEEIGLGVLPVKDLIEDLPRNSPIEVNHVTDLFVSSILIGATQSEEQSVPKNPIDTVPVSIWSNTTDDSLHDVRVEDPCASLDTPSTIGRVDIVNNGCPPPFLDAVETTVGLNTSDGTFLPNASLQPTDLILRDDEKSTGSRSNETNESLVVLNACEFDESKSVSRTGVESATIDLVDPSRKSEDPIFGHEDFAAIKNNPGIFPVSHTSVETRTIEVSNPPCTSEDPITENFDTTTGATPNEDRIKSDASNEPSCKKPLRKLIPQNDLMDKFDHLSHDMFIPYTDQCVIGKRNVNSSHISFPSIVYSQTDDRHRAHIDGNPTRKGLERSMVKLKDMNMNPSQVSESYTDPVDKLTNEPSNMQQYTPPCNKKRIRDIQFLESTYGRLGHLSHQERLIAAIKWHQMISQWKHKNIARTMKMGMSLKAFYENNSLTSNNIDGMTLSQVLGIEYTPSNDKMESRIAGNGSENEKEHEPILHSRFVRDDQKTLLSNLLSVAQSDLNCFTNLIEDMVTFAIESSTVLNTREATEFFVNIKIQESIVTKASRKYQGDVLRVKDVLRASIIFLDETALFRCLLYLHQYSQSHENFSIVRVKNLFWSLLAGSLVPTDLATGYRHVLVNVRLKSGLITGERSFYTDF